MMEKLGKLDRQDLRVLPERKEAWAPRDHLESLANL